MQVPDYQIPFYARWPASDLHIAYTILRRREYAPMADLLDRTAEITFLDIGANIGAASKFFLETFPNGKVVAVEPDAGNAQICRLNLKPYGSRAQVIEAAAWKKNAVLVFESEVPEIGVEAGIRVREIASGDPLHKSVRGIDIPTLLSETGVPPSSKIALKIDVEGSEQEIFSATALRWLDRTCCIAIELHDSVRKNSSSNFFSAVEHHMIDPATKIGDTVFVRLKAGLDPDRPAFAHPRIQRPLAGGAGVGCDATC